MVGFGNIEDCILVHSKENILPCKFQELEVAVVVADLTVKQWKEIKTIKNL